jgi:hypothetical protein
VIDVAYWPISEATPTGRGGGFLGYSGHQTLLCLSHMGR